MRHAVRNAVRADIEKWLSLGIGGGVGEVRHLVAAHAPGEPQHDVQELAYHARRAVAGCEASLFLLLDRRAGVRDQVLAGLLGRLEPGAADTELLRAGLGDPPAARRVGEVRYPMGADALRVGDR